MTELVRQPTTIKGKEAVSLEDDSTKRRVSSDLLRAADQRAKATAERFLNLSGRRIEGKGQDENDEEYKSRVKVARNKAKEWRKEADLLARVSSLPKERECTSEQILMRIAAEAISLKETEDPELQQDIKGNIGDLLVSLKGRETLRSRVGGRLDLKTVSPPIYNLLEGTTLREVMDQTRLSRASDRATEQYVAEIIENPVPFLERRLAQNEKNTRSKAPAKETESRAAPVRQETENEIARRISAVAEQILKGGRLEDVKKSHLTSGWLTESQLEQAHQLAVKAAAQRAAKDETYAYGNLDHRVRDEVADAQLAITKGEKAQETEAEKAEELLARVKTEMKKADFRNKLNQIMREEDLAERKINLGDFLKNKGIPAGAILLTLLLQMFSSTLSESRR